MLRSASRPNLRRASLSSPGCFRTLCGSLRESGGSAEEIERGEVSVADLEPLDGNGYLLAARGLKTEDRNYERGPWPSASRPPKGRDPGLPHAYAEGARLAELGRRTRKPWSEAAGNLLRQEWPVRSDELQHSLAGSSRAPWRRTKLDKAEGDKLRQAIAAQKKRDLVIKLLWQGEADLDLGGRADRRRLHAAGPAGPSAAAPLLADSLLESQCRGRLCRGRGVLRRVSGDGGTDLGQAAGQQGPTQDHPSSGARPQETEQVIAAEDGWVTIAGPVTIELEAGRRTKTAYAAAARRTSCAEEDPRSLENPDQVLNKLRDLANPEVTGFERGVHGGTVSSGREVPGKESSALPDLHEPGAASVSQPGVVLRGQHLDVTARGGPCPRIGCFEL